METDYRNIDKVNKNSLKPAKAMMSYLGNTEILKKYKIAFLCSRKCPAGIILKSLDWAIEKKEKKECVISGFHSKIEKDVFDILIRGNQPLILILARGMKQRWPVEIKRAIEKNRLLVISPYKNSVKYITQETANKRNKIMTDLADEIVTAHYTRDGNLYRLIKTLKNKKISSFS